VSDVEKVPQLMLVVVQGSGYKQARVLDAAVHHSIWRPAAHDGTPFPRGVAVLLLPASLEDQVPENHLLRMIDRHVNLEFIRAKLKDAYSDAGRPSIDPELLLHMLLVGYLYGVTSERKLVEGLRMHLAWRWFTGLGFDQEIPHHSTFSKNRHGRFQESNLFQEIFEEIVARCVEAGLVKGEHMSVDGGCKPTPQIATA
jgi:transposase